MLKKTEDVIITGELPYNGHFKVYWTNVWFGRIRCDKEKRFCGYKNARDFYKKKKGEKIK